MQYLDLNPKKFQFCQEEVEFAGFLLTPTMVKPLPKYIDSIRNFPRPANITDIRAWFDLVNRSPTTASLQSSWTHSDLS